MTTNVHESHAHHHLEFGETPSGSYDPGMAMAELFMFRGLQDSQPEAEVALDTSQDIQDVPEAV